MNDDLILDKDQNIMIKKIDFVLKHMGGETVTRRIKEITKNRTFTELVSKDDWVPQYRAALDEMISEIEAVLTFA